MVIAKSREMGYLPWEPLQTRLPGLGPPKVRATEAVGKGNMVVYYNLKELHAFDLTVTISFRAFDVFFKVQNESFSWKNIYLEKAN